MNVPMMLLRYKAPTIVILGNMRISRKENNIHQSSREDMEVEVMEVGSIIKGASQQFVSAVVKLGTWCNFV